MKKIVLILSFIAISYSGFTQDQIFKKDNTTLTVKIIEKSELEIKYKLFNYADGPLITIPCTDVIMIKYENGTQEVIQQKPKTEIVEQQFPEITPKTSIKLKSNEDLLSTKNVIFINVMEPLNGTFAMSYLREFADNLLNVYLPISTGFAVPLVNNTLNGHTAGYGNYVDNYNFTRKNFEVGLGVHFQTSGKRKVTHFIGPYASVAQYTGRYFIQEINSNNDIIDVQKIFTLNRYYMMLDNGVLFRITKNFNMMLNAAIGYRSDDFINNSPKNYPNKKLYSLNLHAPAFKFGLHFGYRF